MISAERAQTVGREVEEFANTHAGGAEQEQAIGNEIILVAEILLEKAVVLRCEGSGEIRVGSWEIAWMDKIASDGVLATER